MAGIEKERRSYQSDGDRNQYPRIYVTTISASHRPNETKLSHR